MVTDISANVQPPSMLVLPCYPGQGRDRTGTEGWRSPFAPLEEGQGVGCVRREQGRGIKELMMERRK